MKPSKSLLTVFAAFAIAIPALLTGCGSLNKALLSPPTPVVETSPSGVTVTNFVQHPSAAVTNAVAIGELVAPLLPPPQGQGLTAILGLAAGVLAAYGKYQGSKRRQETAVLELKAEELRAAKADADWQTTRAETLLTTVIKGVETAPAKGLNAKASIADEAKKAQVTGLLYEKVQEVTK